MFGIGGFEIAVLLVALAAVAAVPAVGFYRISKRAGYNTPTSVVYGVVSVVPVVGWAVPIILGFVAWPRDAGATDAFDIVVVATGDGDALTTETDEVLDSEASIAEE